MYNIVAESEDNSDLQLLYGWLHEEKKNERSEYSHLSWSLQCGQSFLSQ